MFVVDLLCNAGHSFEGWFERSEDARAQLDKGSLECPVCGGTNVTRRLGFAAVGNRGSDRPLPARRPHAAERAVERAGERADERAGDAVAPPALPLEIQRALSSLLRAVRTHGEDVGERFATVARRIHSGEEEARLVYGSASPDEARALVEDGVPFAAIPIPEIDQN